MFFINDDSELSVFVDTWMECYNEDPDNVEINVCQTLNISMKDAIKKAGAIQNQGVKLPGYNRKRMKRLKG